MRRPVLVVPLLALHILPLAAACVGAPQSECSMAAAPTNPVEVPRSWSQGYAVVIGTVGERDGRTKVYSPGYRADRYGLTVDQVVMTGHRPPGAPDEGTTAVWNDEDVAALDSVANVHYPDQSPSCGGKAQHASLETGERMMLILAPPDPSKGVWTVDGAAAALDLSGEEASPVAEWQLQTGTCAGHLAYDLATLTAAFAQPATASTLQSTCVAD